MAREKWDAADAQAEQDEDEDDPMDPLMQNPKPAGRSILPDWTRSPLPHGAPSAKAQSAPQPALNIVVTSPSQIAVS